jgi:membrane-associated phospholipid phosphatase
VATHLGSDPSVRRRHAALIGTAAGAGAVFVVLTAAFWVGSSVREEPASVPSWTRLSDAASWRVLPLVTLVIALGLAVAGRRASALFLLVSVAGAGVVMYAARIVLQVVGADNDAGRLSDFPSGHTTATTALVGALTVIVWDGSRSRAVRVLTATAAVASVVVVGWARVDGGGHTWLDVFGGAALGIAWLALCLLVVPPDGSRSLTRRQILGASLVVGLTGFVFLAVLYRHEPLMSADQDVARWVADNMPASADSTARAVTHLGGAAWSWIVGIGLTLALLVARRFRDAVWADVTLLGIHLVTGVLKEAFDRPRPHEGSAVALPASVSFPSGHAAGAVVTFGVVAALAAERWPARQTWIWTLAVLLALAVGASRVVLDVHYVTDVLAGWCLGLAWLAAALLVRDALRSSPV